MKKPSRKIPQIKEDKNKLDNKRIIRFFSPFFLGDFIYLLIEIPVIIPLLALIIAISYILDRQHQAKLHKIATERKEDSICTFARSFDYRSVDTHVIRAVYEYFQKYLKDYYNLTNFPIRKEDSIGLFIDEEDLEYDWVEIAERIGRSSDIEDTKKNPFNKQFCTAEDVVLFLAHQPLKN